MLLVLALALVAIFYRIKTPHLINKLDPLQKETGRTIVFFAYHEGSFLEARNLEYFVEAGIWNQPDIDFIVIVNGQNCSICLQKESKIYLPNVRILHRENEGFDFAGYSEALSSIMHSDYSYFLFLNGGVRGPLLPCYQLQNLQRWHTIFTSMFNERVKLVGPTISCELQVHVQSHMFALDSTGLSLALNNHIFTASGKSIDELITYSELGLTDTIMNAGYTIDCLLLQYQGWNWEVLWRSFRRGRRKCNNGLNPNYEQAYGSSNPQSFVSYTLAMIGIPPRPSKKYSVSPLDIVFQKRGGSLHSKCKLKMPGRYGTPEQCDYDLIAEELSDAILVYVKSERDKSLRT